MKKRCTLLATMMALIMLCMTACGGGSSIPEEFAGKYSLNSVKIDDHVLNLKEYGDLAGMSEEEAKNLIVIELKKDGTCTLNMPASDTENGKWKADGEKVTITPDKEGEKAMDVTIKDDIMSYDDGDTQMTLKKE